MTPQKTCRGKKMVHCSTARAKSQLLQLNASSDNLLAPSSSAPGTKYYWGSLTVWHLGNWTTASFPSLKPNLVCHSTGTRGASSLHQQPTGGLWTNLYLSFQTLALPKVLFPQFNCTTSQGPVTLHDWMPSKWGSALSHSRVCQNFLEMNWKSLYMAFLTLSQTQLFVSGLLKGQPLKPLVWYFKRLLHLMAPLTIRVRQYVLRLPPGASDLLTTAFSS